MMFDHCFLFYKPFHRQRLTRLLQTPRTKRMHGVRKIPILNPQRNLLIVQPEALLKTSQRFFALRQKFVRCQSRACVQLRFQHAGLGQRQTGPGVEAVRTQRQIENVVLDRFNEIAILEVVIGQKIMNTLHALW